MQLLMRKNGKIKYLLKLFYKFNEALIKRQHGQYISVRTFSKVTLNIEPTITLKANMVV